MSNWTLQVSDLSVLEWMSVLSNLTVLDWEMSFGRFFVFSEPVTSVSFTRDGQCALVSSLDNTLRLLDKDTGEMLNE